MHAWNVRRPDGTVKWYARPFPLISALATEPPRRDHTLNPDDTATLIFDNGRNTPPRAWSPLQIDHAAVNAITIGDLAAGRVCRYRVCS
jgi:hypothetical protein